MWCFKNMDPHALGAAYRLMNPHATARDMLRANPYRQTDYRHGLWRLGAIETHQPREPKGEYHV